MRWRCLQTSLMMNILMTVPRRDRGIILRSKRSSFLICKAISYSLHVLSIHTDSHYTIDRKWILRPSTVTKRRVNAYYTVMTNVSK